MRKVVFGVANSLDNFIARPDHGVDWLLWGPEAAAVTRDYWKSFDTMLMGRKTYEVAAEGGSSSAAGWGLATYVFSRTLPPGPRGGATVIAEDAGAFVARLKNAEGRNICVMGGGELAKSLFEADAIDEIGLNIHPTLLGSGIPLFPPMNRQVDLELVECRPFKNGCVYVTYRVKHAAGRKPAATTKPRKRRG